jgi:hypothetical protein
MGKNKIFLQEKVVVRDRDERWKGEQEGVDVLC